MHQYYRDMFCVPIPYGILIVHRMYCTRIFVVEKSVYFLNHFHSVNTLHSTQIRISMYGIGPQLQCVVIAVIQAYSAVWCTAPWLSIKILPLAIILQSSLHQILKAKAQQKRKTEVYQKQTVAVLHSDYQSTEERGVFVWLLSSNINKLSPES